MNAEPQPVLTETFDEVLLITINRPETRNAINQEVTDALGQAFDRLDQDGSIATAVLTGADPGFCAGMDLKEFVSTGVPSDPQRGFAAIVKRPPEKPIIAAVEGFAVAGGFEIALACDLLVAASGARLGVPEVTRSIVAAGGALLRLPRKLPYAVASELALTGQPITAERGLELGLVNRVTSPGSTVEAACELAATIAKNGPLALAATKRILAAQWDWQEADFWRLQDEISASVFASEDAREGAVAFAEKRDPVWKRR